MHSVNSFITLTIDQKHLISQSLHHEHWQLFMKRLRNALGRQKYAKSIEISESCYNSADMGFHPIPQTKYYMAGEYGSKTRRPHYHACLFGIDFLDKKYYATGKNNARIYTSPTLEKLWGMGFATIGEVTYESAAYIARYIIDKKTGDNASKYYEHIDYETGEITQLKPEYNKMSLRTAIGKEWHDKFATDVYPHGHVITRGVKNKAPEYYDNLYRKKEPVKHADMKRNRIKEQIANLADNTPQRLQAKETVTLARVNQLLRDLE